MKREEYAIILDFLAIGYPGGRHGEAVAQAVGQSFFSLLELIPKESVVLKQEETVYIGEGKRDKIRLIRRRLELNELTNTALMTLEYVLEDLIKKNEKQFLDFFNTASTVTPRLHQLDLLPGIGKKYVGDIINKRPYQSFEDISKKTNLHDVLKIIKKRIMDELKGSERYYLFTRPIRRDEFR